jgi:uncharacterized protein YkwD
MNLRRTTATLLLLPFLAQCSAALPSLFGGGGGAPAHRVSTSTGEARSAAALISQYRKALGLPPVVADGALNRAAEVQARAVAQAGSLSHGQFASRMSNLGIMGHAAENLEAGSKTAAEAIARWKASPGHNRNLLMPEARRVGIAYAKSPGAGYEHYWALVLASEPER